MKYRGILIEKEKNLARIIINRPALNILDIATLTEMNKAFARLEKEKPLLLVFSGAGENFSSGVEIKEHFPKTVRRMLTSFHSLLRRILYTDLITCAAVDGYAFGGGCELALACDFVFATPKAVFAQPEVGVGCFPPFGAAYFPFRIGKRAATELILERKGFSAEEAEKSGFVNQVSDDLNDSVWKLYEKLKRFSPTVLRAAKRAFVGPKAAFESRLKYSEDIYLHKLVKLKDMGEGLSAFLEKRPPIWKGK